LSEEEFADRLSEALWLAHYEADVMAKAIEVGVTKAIANVFKK
jgi:hypothetical protein